MTQPPEKFFLRVHDFLPASLSNGPGRRAALWLQGCTLACPGCFNPNTHQAGQGTLVAVEDILREIKDLGDSIEGLTISGGEPLQQLPALVELLFQVRASTNLSILLFSGYTWQEIQKMPRGHTLLTYLDVLIAGRYDASQRLASGLIGSSNKSIHYLTSRYSSADLMATPDAEIILSQDGSLMLSGIDPLTF